jgi:hypothetical protein
LFFGLDETTDTFKQRTIKLQILFSLIGEHLLKAENSVSGPPPILNKVIYVTKQAVFKRRSRILGLSFMSAFPPLILILLERLR